MINHGKPLAQVAYEAYVGGEVMHQPWLYVSYPDRIIWDRVATAVAIALNEEQSHHQSIQQTGHVKNIVEDRLL
jgi:hypothetical protein